MKGQEGEEASVRYLQFKVLFHLAHSTLSPGLVCKCVGVCVLWGEGMHVCVCVCVCCGEVGGGDACVNIR